MKRWRNLHYKQILPGVFFLLLLNCACIGPTIGLGVKDYGEDCDPGHSFSQYETKMCDSVKGLHCNPVQKECKCIISGAYYQRGKCRAKLSKLCGTMDDLVVECVKNSFCNMTGGTGVCHCNGELIANGEGTACYLNGSSHFVPTSFIKGFTILLLLAIVQRV